MFSACACLNLSVEAVRHFLDIQGGHLFLQNGAILEEQMATLNIKKMPDRLYRKIQARASREHRSVAQEVIHILSQATDDAKSLSILELQGLGKEVWSKVDASKYVSKERLVDFTLGTHPISTKGTTELRRSEATKRF